MTMKNIFVLGALKSLSKVLSHVFIKGEQGFIIWDYGMTFWTSKFSEFRYFPWSLIPVFSWNIYISPPPNFVD